MEAVKRKIALCRENTDFASNTRNEKYAECLPIFRKQAQACVGHFQRELVKCDGGGRESARAVSLDPGERRRIQAALTAEQNAVYTVKAPATAAAAGSEPLKVVAWVDHADNTYAVGDRVRLFVQANKDAYLTVLTVGASGQTTVLFPNAHQTGSRVSANQVVEVPAPSSGANITVGGPTGRELIKAIASTKPTPLLAAWAAPAVGLFTSLKSSSWSVAKDLQVTMETQTNQEWDDYNLIIHTI